jgi:hypothetical protein
MANNSVVIDLLLQDAKFKLSIDKATDSAKDLRKEIEKADGPVAGLRSGFDKLKGGIGGVLDSVFSLKGALAAAASVLAFDKIIDAAVEADNAVNAAANSLRLSGEYSKEALKNTQAFAANLQDLTGIGDDTALSMFSLAQSYGLSADKAKETVKAATDLAAATGQDLTTAVTNLSAAYNGNIGKLGKLNPALKDLTEAELAAGAATRLLAEQFGGSAAAKLDTFAGALDATKARFGDVVEEIGFLIVKNGTVISLVKTLGDAFKILSTFISDNADGLRDFISKPIKSLIRELPNIIRSIGVLGEAFVLVLRVNPFTGLNESASETSSIFDEVSSHAAELADGILAIVQGYYNLKRVVGENSALVTIFAPEEITQAQAQVEQIEKLRQKLADTTTQIATPDGLKNAYEGPKSLVDDLAKAFENLADKIEKVPTSVDIEVAALSGRSGGSSRSVKGNGADFGPGSDLKAGPRAEDFFGSGVEIGGFIQGALDEFADGLFVVGKSFAQNILGGKEGARKFLGAAAGAAADAFVPGLGQAVAPFVEALSQGKEAVKAQVTAFAEALPELIDALVEAIPVFVQVLADNAPEIIIALANGMPQVAASLAIALTNPQLYIGVAKELGRAAYEGTIYQFQQLGQAFGIAVTDLTNAGHQAGVNFAEFFKTAFPQAFKEAVASLGNFFADIGSRIAFGLSKTFVQALVDGATKFVSKLIDEIKGKFSSGGKATIGGSGEGPVEQATGVKIPGVYAATGGMVKGLGNRDSVRAMLSPGELVLDRTTGPRLNAFLDEATKPASRSQDSEMSQVMLAKVIDLLQQPLTVQTTAEVDGRTLADIILTLTRNNQRLFA